MVLMCGMTDESVRSGTLDLVQRVGNHAQAGLDLGYLDKRVDEIACILEARGLNVD